MGAAASDFPGHEDLLRDFLTQATELLCGLDNRLIALERSPEDDRQLDAVLRDFHTIKGGAGFLGATELVRLCHLTESLFDQLRSGKLKLEQTLMDTIFAATAEIRRMFGELGQGLAPTAAASTLLNALEAVIGDEAHLGAADCACAQSAMPAVVARRGPDWTTLWRSIAGSSGVVSARPHPSSPVMPAVASGAPASDRQPSRRRRATDRPGAAGMHGGRRASDPRADDMTIRIDAAQLDQVLGLTGEIGSARNQLRSVQAELNAGHHGADTLTALDASIGRLDRLVGDLQVALTKTRMQPAGRLFQRYPRLARDLARELGKNVEVRLQGEDIELDRLMIEELSESLMHLVRNAVDHGVESPVERKGRAKPAQASIVLAARRSGDYVVITIADDGRGMRPDALRRRAIEKGLLAPEIVNAMDDRSALQLILLPGFSTRDQISSISGRGVGMDVVKTNVQRLNGRIEIASIADAGTTIAIELPATPAVWPVPVGSA